jgi:outer membrane protein assembly factor BamB
MRSTSKEMASSNGSSAEMPQMEAAIKPRVVVPDAWPGVCRRQNFYSTLDGQVFALNADNGKVVWRAENANIAIGETVSATPLVVGDKVIIGVMGGERGRARTHNRLQHRNGSMRWRYYSMGPNNEVGIGPRFKPFYADDKVPNPALDSWYGDSWKRGGGSIWGWYTFDPDLNLFYYGTSNCGPWNPDYRRKFGSIDLDEKGELTSYKNNYCARYWRAMPTAANSSGPTTRHRRMAGIWMNQRRHHRGSPDWWPNAQDSCSSRKKRIFLRLRSNDGEMILKPWAFVYND